MSYSTRSPAASHTGLYRILVACTLIAVILGTVARFKGLGTWPFGVDEYYFGKSVQNVLRFGVPAFECGGYYPRGVLLQYLSAGLQLMGLSPELAPRSISAVSSLLALPAVFLIGRKLHGTNLGLLAVALLSLSVWEIEMGRFGRFYAPFQAVFLWYLVYFLRYTVDRERDALRGMLALSILSVLVWEGALLLAVANLLPPFLNHDRGRLTSSHWRYLAGMTAILLALYWFVNFDFRQVQDNLPPDIDEVVSEFRPDSPVESKQLFDTVTMHPLLALVGLIPLAIAVWALQWIFGLRERWLAATGLLLALAAALLHQFLVVVAVLALLLVARILDWRELLDRRAWPFLGAIALAAVFWLAFGFGTAGWRPGPAMPLSEVVVELAYQLIGFPDVLEMVARPWGQAVPILGASLLLLLVVTAGRVILAGEAAAPTERTLLVVALVMLLFVGAANAPRVETRYSFFLYPLLMVLALAMLLRVVEFLSRESSIASLLGIVAAATWFGFTEDFQPRHLINIDSPEINFRQGMKPRVGGHYYSRGDMRATAEWLATHATRPDDLVVSGPGIASLDFYFPGIDFVYIHPSDHRLQAWSCRGGTVERWSNLPMVYRPAELQARIQESPRTYLVIASSQVESFLPEIQQLAPATAWVNDRGNHTILTFDPGGATAQP